MELKLKILEAIKEAQNGSLYYDDIYTNQVSIDSENEFLFFIKPELTQESEKIDLSSIIDMIIKKIEEFNLHICNIKVLSAKYLDDYDIIAQHYGVINRIAKQAVNSISDNAKENFAEIFNKKIGDCIILGGIEFLQFYKTFNPLSLDYLWQNKKNHKLAGGTYCMDIKIDADEVYLVNGFHPRQLLHFTEKGKSIIVFTLKGSLDWNIARNNFIGATNPNNANLGSIRKTLLENKSKLGLNEVSQGINGVHLSAGPVEGLIELIRYNNNYSTENKIMEISDFRFGKQLITNFNIEQINEILSNRVIFINDKKTSVFDITEELNSHEAIELLKQYF